MLHAIFDALNTSAAVNGAYQYDTGQRLRMYGLPTPEELADADEFLSGDMATVQVHFGMKGDSQTEARLALWNDAEGCWESAVPDSCLQAAENVYGYVYVGYGMDDESNGRTKTMYELTFRPIERPAPNNVATNEQWEAWATKKDELEIAANALETAAASLDGATTNAQEAASDAADAALAANNAATSAQQAQARLEAQATLWGNTTVQVIDLPSGSSAYVKRENGVLIYGIPVGVDGAQGATGDTGPADIGFSISDGVLTITPK